MAWRAAAPPLLLAILLWAVCGFARGSSNNPNPLTLDECTAELSPGDICALHVSKIRPSQFGYSATEVEGKTRHAEQRYSSGNWETVLTTYRVPVVVAPRFVTGGEKMFHCIDHHHHLLGVQRAEVPDDIKVVLVRIDTNWSDAESEDEFWRRMVMRSKVWLYDGADMHPDPFRSLSYHVRTHDGFHSSLFGEFKWGIFFRDYVEVPSAPAFHELQGPSGWCRVRPHSNECLPEGWSEDTWVKLNGDRCIDIARSSAASHLPGYDPDLSD